MFASAWPRSSFTILIPETNRELRYATSSLMMTVWPQSTGDWLW